MYLKIIIVLEEYFQVFCCGWSSSVLKDGTVSHQLVRDNIEKCFEQQKPISTQTRGKEQSRMR